MADNSKKTKAKVSNFERLFNQADGELIKQRTSILKEKTLRVSRNKVEEIKDSISTKKIEIEELKDLGRKSTTDLTVTKMDVDDWYNQILDLEIEIKNLSDELDVVNKLHEDLFGENENED